MTSNIIGVRFTKIGKIYHFDSKSLSDLKTGEHVIVDTSRGRHLGEVVQILEETPPQPEGGWKSVERRATPRDLLLQQSWQSKQTEAMINCRARASELRLKDVKIVTAEYNYDGSRLAFLFSTESEEKVDLKSLKKDMQQLYPTTQIEMRQIGPRDVAKFLGGMGACGIETRCCSKFLTDFSPISIKMAKEQGSRSLRTRSPACADACVAASFTNMSNTLRHARPYLNVTNVSLRPKAKARS